MEFLIEWSCPKVSGVTRRLRPPHYRYGRDWIHVKIDFISFPPCIWTSKSITVCSLGGHHKLRPFCSPNLAHREYASLRFLLIILDSWIMMHMNLRRGCIDGAHVLIILAFSHLSRPRLKLVLFYWWYSCPHQRRWLKQVNPYANWALFVRLRQFVLSTPFL